MAHVGIISRRHLLRIALRRPTPAAAAAPQAQSFISLHSKNHYQTPTVAPPILHCHHIFVRATGKVRVIDENGENLGLMSISEGVNLAKAKAFDLVQISPTDEPVCRFMDFAKTIEDKARTRVASLKQQAAVKKKDKELRLGTSISDKDLETKLRQAKEFLSEQRTVTINILYRRSKALRVEDRKARGEEIAAVVDSSFQDVATMIGKKDTLGFLSLIYKPLPENTKRKKQKEKEKEKARLKPTK